MNRAKIIFMLIILFPAFIYAANPGDVVLNEIAWGGTKAGSGHEWLELYNNTDSDINIQDWTVEDSVGVVANLTGSRLNNSTITARGYYLIEWKSNDGTKESISDITGDFQDLEYQKLSNSGEYMVLKDSNGTVIDSLDCSGGWFAGSGSPDYDSMERIGPTVSGNDQWNWEDNNGITRNGHDWDNNELNATPRTKNSVYKEGGAEAEKKTEKIIEVASSPFYPHQEGNRGPGKTVILYNVPDGSLRTMRIFDINGRLVKTLMNQERGRGQQSMEWDGKNDSGQILPVGIYIVHIIAVEDNTGRKREGRAMAVLGR